MGSSASSKRPSSSAPSSTVRMTSAKTSQTTSQSAVESQPGTSSSEKQLFPNDSSAVQLTGPNWRELLNKLANMNLWSERRETRDQWVTYLNQAAELTSAEKTPMKTV